MDPEKAAIAFLRRLIDKAQWYNSAIELDHDVDGEKLLSEAKLIVSKEPKEPRPKDDR